MARNFLMLRLVLQLGVIASAADAQFSCGSRYLALSRGSCNASSMSAALPTAAYLCSRQCSLNPLCRLMKLSQTGACQLVMDSEALSFTVAAGECAMLRIDYNRLAIRGSRKFYIFQKRMSDSVSFVKKWIDYENGFGDEKNFWTGLRWIHALTQPQGRTMRMEAVRFNGMSYHCEYSGFLVQGPSTGYTLQFGSMQLSSSNVSGDSLDYHKGMKFQTSDMNCVGTCCSKTRGGTGWWFNSCEFCNPNGIYYSGGESSGDKYVSWDGVVTASSLKEIRLMLEL